MATQKEIDQHLAEIIKENPTQVLLWMLVIMGKEMHQGNVGTMKMETEFDLEDSRYAIVTNCKLKKIKVKKEKSKNDK